MDIREGVNSREDFLRPRCHFMPAANWMNDPNGVIHWDGRYHLFFQYNPDGAWHGNMHWGHAVSDDLVHWRELPIAIAPTPNSPDQGGVFSGCMVDDGGVPTAIYTGVNDDYSRQVQCLATGNDDLTKWVKHPCNPIIGCAPPELGQTRDFRDPFVWRGDDCWYLLLASHIVGVGGAVLLYRSRDLLDWQYLHPLFVGDKARNGRNFECPNFFPLGDKWVLIVSSQLSHAPSTTLYFVGRFEDERFVPESEGVYDAGYSYASLCSEDEQGRRLIYSWIREGRSVAKQRESGWTGVQAIPRQLWLDERKRLCSRPVPELEALRGPHCHFDAGEVGHDDLPLGGFALDIEVEFAVAGGICGLEMARSESGWEKLAVLYDQSTETLQIRRQYDHDDPELDAAPQGMSHRLDAGENLRLRMLFDGSVLEVIANDRSRITSRFYPGSAENATLRVINPASVGALDIWEMASIW